MQNKKSTVFTVLLAQGMRESNTAVMSDYPRIFKPFGCFSLITFDYLLCAVDH